MIYSLTHVCAVAILRKEPQHRYVGSEMDRTHETKKSGSGSGNAENSSSVKMKTNPS